MQAKQRQSFYRESFLFALIIALSFLLPYMIIDKGLFLFYGDYDVQQVPFYMLMHDSIRSGNIFWSWYTDLGSNFLGSYAFYNVGSPFFWLTLPLPDKLVPYCLGPLLCLKIATASLTSSAYISRFVKNKELAVLGGLLYAFSSFSVYNIFFNHFHEALAFFPLMLIALEELVVNDRKGMFALTVLLSALTNYFFFIEEVVFLVIYWIIRLFSGEWEVSFKKFLNVAFESVLGVGLSAVLFLPAMLQVMGNTRINTLLSGWNLLVYGWAQRLPDIIHSVFFPQDLPAFPNFFPDSGANWSSVAAWLPLFSMTGVIAFMAAKKGHWLKRIIVASFVIALIPGLNAMFVLMVDSYYGRWFFMPVLMMCTATIMALDDPEIDLMHGLKWTVLFTAAFALTIGLIPKLDENKKITQIGIEAFPSRFWIYVAIVAGGLLITYLLVKRFGNDRKQLANIATLAVTVVVCIYGNFFIATGKSYGYDPTWFTNVSINGASQIKLDKSSDGNYDYRIDVYSGIDNQALFWRVPTIQAFNTVISSSTMQFYPSIGVTRDVASRPETSVAGIRPLLSVKYLFDSNVNDTSIAMPGWEAIGTQIGFKVFQNTNYIPFGFTYDDYLTQTQLNNSTQKDRILLKGMLLSSTQIKTYANILQPLPDSQTYALSDDDMAVDCKSRNLHTCSEFSRDNYGFSAKISLERSNLVFFSVPYDKGWTATVNGKSVKVEEVNSGFMAVLCPVGTSSIRFNYMTPGLYAGLGVTGGSVLILILYLILAKKYAKKKKKLLPAPVPEEKDIEYPSVWAIDSAPDVPLPGEPGVEGAALPQSPESDDAPEVQAPRVYAPLWRTKDKNEWVVPVLIAAMLLAAVGYWVGSTIQSAMNIKADSALNASTAAMADKNAKAQNVSSPGSTSADLQSRLSGTESFVAGVLKNIPDITTKVKAE